MTAPASALCQLAELSGVLLEYYDVSGSCCPASERSLLAVLRTLGIDINSADEAEAILKSERKRRLSRGIEPVFVSWDSAPVDFVLSLPHGEVPETVALTITLEDLETRREAFLWEEGEEVDSGHEEFTARRFRSTESLPFGYHSLEVAAGDRLMNAMVFTAPVQAWNRGENRHDWGMFLPLYALRSEHAWASADYTDLEQFGEWIGEQGGQLVGTLPILPAYLDEPCEPSPYSPVSRQLWNEGYIDVTRAAEYEQMPEVQKLVADAQAEIEKWRDEEMVAYEPQMALKRRVMELMAKRIRTSDTPRRKEFLKFLVDHPIVSDYATFRAAREQLGHPWMDWPTEAKQGTLTPNDYDETVKRYFQYAQFLAHEQLGEVHKNLLDRGVELYLDLPLGVRGDGFDVWQNQHCYATTASAGAPPDALYTSGQNWGFPPLHPDGIRENGYKHVRAFLGHLLGLCGRIRIDHVMGLHRLYWIPFDVNNDEGVYVRYQPEEFYAILCIESHRRESIVIGENLGTVPPAVNEQMDWHRIRTMTITEYEVEAEHMQWMNEIPANSISSINTHDMSPFPGWWNGDDIVTRNKIGLITQEQVHQERERRERIKQALVDQLVHSTHLEDADRTNVTAIIRAMHNYMAGAPTELLLVNMEDLWGETRPQNVPGTWKEHPNWQRKATKPFEEWATDPEIQATIDDIKKFRSYADA